MKIVVASNNDVGEIPCSGASKASTGKKDALASAKEKKEPRKKWQGTARWWLIVQWIDEKLKGGIRCLGRMSKAEKLRSKNGLDVKAHWEEGASKSFSALVPHKERGSI